MNNLIATVFQIIGILVLSLLLFALVFGDTGKTFVWDSVEPAFQANWEVYTYKDGEMLKGVRESVFESTKVKDSWQ